MVHSIKYVKAGSLKPFAGKAKSWKIKIDERYRSDKGLLEHELVHVRQWWTKGLIIHGIRYQFSRDYRYACEIEAYRKQLKFYNNPNIFKFAKFIMERYDLKVHLTKIIKDLGG